MRNNYADLDAEARTLVQVVQADGSSPVPIEIAANADQFWVIEYITVSASNADTTITYKDPDGSNPNIVWDVASHGNDVDHVPFGSGLYEQNTPKNRKVVIDAPIGAHICLKYK